MVDFGTPYAVDGTVIPGAGLRRQLQQSSGPGSGIVWPEDLKVTPLDVPGAGVKIAAGDDLIQCREPGRERETYGIPLFQSGTYLGDAGTGIPGTGSSGGRRDMIIHEVVDPGLDRTYTPRAQIPEGVYSKISVVPGVPADAKTVADVPALADVTCVELAAINWPASTGTITAGILEDLRRMQRPREQRQQELKTVVSETLTGTTEKQFPSAAQQVEIPAWATELRVMARMLGLLGTGPVSVEFRLRLGATVYSAVSGLTTTTAAGVAERIDKTVPMQVAIPAAMRGTTQPLVVLAKRNVTTGTLAANDRTSVEFDTTLIARPN